MIGIVEKYKQVRSRSALLCASLKTEDYVVQPTMDVSPPKWHLGHTSWFFETFILKEHLEGYTLFDDNFAFVFNSYYESLGARVIRTDRGNLSRPTVEQIYAYRDYVDRAMERLLAEPITERIQQFTILGINHEQQHQELLATDIKYILGHNPLFPTYTEIRNEVPKNPAEEQFIRIKEGMYAIGHTGEGFCFDNELSPHKVYLGSYQISNRLVTNEEYLAFMKDGGYQNHFYWHAEGLDWVKNNGISAPLYWHNIDNKWQVYAAEGLQELDLHAPVAHVSYYEAAAYAAWRGMRLPTEFEWEAASRHLNWGERWEWTNSAYLPYPGFVRSAGPEGEYNGKFMVSQMVLRGASIVTPPGHSRATYRNFFHPPLRWQYTGIRLAKNED